MRRNRFFLILFFLWSTSSLGQLGGFIDDDMELGSDIFADFSEDITEKEMAEDERFYRYSRFFSFSVGIGGTFYDGNRGAAYTNQNMFFDAIKDFTKAISLNNINKNYHF